MLFNFAKHALSITIASVAVLCLAAAVPAGATTVTYSASGTFATPALQGQDNLKLAGQPFTVAITGTEGTPPSKTGTGYAIYDNLAITGTFYSGLLPGVPIPVPSGTLGNLYLQIGQKMDTIKISTTVLVLNVNLTLTASAPMPLKTISNLKIGPFAHNVTLKSPYSILTYSGLYMGTQRSTTVGANGSIATTTAAAPPTRAETATPLKQLSPAFALVSRRRYAC